MTLADRNLATVNGTQNDMVLEPNIVAMSGDAITKNITSEAARPKNSGKRVMAITLPALVNWRSLKPD